MVKKENFSSEMCWKSGIGGDNLSFGNCSEEDIQKLETVERQDMSFFKSTTLEQVVKVKEIRRMRVDF